MFNHASAERDARIVLARDTTAIRVTDVETDEPVATVSDGGVRATVHVGARDVRVLLVVPGQK
jgi:hypothetical protein